MKENKNETRRLLTLAKAIRVILEKRDRYDANSVADLIKLAEYADTLSALVLHEDTEIRVLE